MNDFAAKTSSSLAITEKKAHRPGGCVGIFFQLFDWNRRFAKKKLFPKKLLPLARTKQVSKKFNADEKLPMPKHLLIADENTGGFPLMKKNSHRGADLERKQEMRAPGLVARLMGLETMPVIAQKEESVPFVQQRRPNKGSVSENCNENGGNFVNCGLSGSDKEDLHFEKGSVRHELRPQKVQKTGLSERHPVTRFGADALQIKNVLSRSRKHHPKLSSPVKSPRIARNTSRLIDAATRILEPGLQATNRAKCALMYSNSAIQPRRHEVMGEAKTDVDLPTPSNCCETAPVSLRGQTSCRNCGNLLEAADLKFVLGEEAPEFDLGHSNIRDVFLKGVEECNPSPTLFMEREREVVLLRSKYPRDCLPAQAKANIPARVEINVDSEDPSQASRDQQNFMSRSCIRQYDSLSSIALKHRAQRQSQMLIEVDKVQPKHRMANTQMKRVPSMVNTVDRKDLTAINRNMNQSQLKVTSRLDNLSEAERKYSGGRYDSLSTQRNPVRKRTANVSRQAGGFGSASSMLENPRSVKNKIPSGSRLRLSADPANQTCGRSAVSSEECNMTNGSRDSDVAPFALISPFKSNELSYCSAAMDEQKLVTEANCGAKSSQNSFMMNKDALGALLEQKLKELTSQVVDESEAGLVPSARTTASILQELIAALTAANPISQDAVNRPEEKDMLQSNGTSGDTAFQNKSLTKRSSVGDSLMADHFSPGSVLDTSFSNESCSSSSMDDISGNMMQSNCMDFSYDRPQKFYTDADLFGSASSETEATISQFTLITDLLNHISAVLQNLNFAQFRLTGTGIDHINEVILNTELLFGNPSLPYENRFVDFLLGPFLEELEAVAIASWNSIIVLDFESTKVEIPLKGFLFDCLIEYLDLKYRRYCNSGFRTWMRISLLVNTELSVQAFHEEVRRWTSFAGKTLDEIIDKEMSVSFGEWTDVDIEAFETGAEIGHALVQKLLDEIVIDLLCE
ncbi:hypothetical protein Nepgr_022506 [Nepenthes gracilis]|uniref:DUF4378 domain-containing protein n=1 Tax=Nepenthes gracilis TaxID=150966 RepID=A0AAD3T0W6_NEPGR|nr:hypothetical protein Nepgr_022506 [Nepenthes gracilis]